MPINPQRGTQYHAESKGGPKHPVWSWIGIFVVLGMLFWQILSLISCSSSRKEYVVDYSCGNDGTAEGSRARPCQTEAYCRMLLDGVSVRTTMA